MNFILGFEFKVIRISNSLPALSKSLIHRLHVSHNAPYFPLPPPPFLLGLTALPRLHATLMFGIINFYSKGINIGRFFSRITSIRPRFHLTLHCITAIHKSPKSLAIVTAKGKADNSVYSTGCVSHKQGDIIRYPKLTIIPSLCWFKTKYCYVNKKGYPANEKRYNDSNGHLKHFSLSSCPLFLSAGWLFTWMGFLFKFDQDEGVKYHQDDKRDEEEQDRKW